MCAKIEGKTKFHTVRTVPISNGKIVARGKIDIFQHIC